MVLLPWPASLLCLLLGYVGVNPTLQADVEKPAVRQIPVGLFEYVGVSWGNSLTSCSSYGHIVLQRSVQTPVLIAQRSQQWLATLEHS